MMNNGSPLWDDWPPERPANFLARLGNEAVARLIELPHREATTELEEKLASMMPPEARQLRITLADIMGERWLDTIDLLCKLIPILVRTLEGRNLMSPGSFEELLQAAISEAGLSPKKREEIVALQGQNTADC